MSLLGSQRELKSTSCTCRFKHYKISRTSFRKIVLTILQCLEKLLKWHSLNQCVISLTWKLLILLYIVCTGNSNSNLVEKHQKTIIDTFCCVFLCRHWNCPYTSNIYKQIMSYIRKPWMADFFIGNFLGKCTSSRLPRKFPTKWANFLGNFHVLNAL